MLGGDIGRASKADVEALRHLSALLHLLHHRNKNQHRRSIWWRSFQLFRKQLNAYTEEMAIFNEIPTSHVARAQKKAKDSQFLQSLKRRLAFWESVMVPKWHHAFSQVAADQRFAMLGLTLIAALSETCRVAGVTADFEEDGQAEVEKVLERFAREGWGNGDVVPRGASESAEDTGEVISRDLIPHEDDPSTNRGPEEATLPPPVQVGSTSSSPEAPKRAAHETTQPVEKRKKKRRKGNAIDDLFSGFG